MSHFVYITPGNGDMMRRVVSGALVLGLCAGAWAQGPADAGRPKAEPETQPEPQATPAPEAPSPKTPAVSRRLRTIPLDAGETRAPSLGKPVSASPDAAMLSDPRKSATFPTEFGSTEAGFVMPNMTEPFRDIEADEMQQGLDTNRLELKGNVRLRLGDMYFQSDAFHYSQDLGEMGAEGNVVIEQANSTLRAGQLSYTLPNPGDIPPPSILEPNTPEAMEQRRLRLGRVQAKDLHVVEPTREIMADSLDYDLLAADGEVLNARGKAGVYYFYAEKLRVTGPDSYEADEVWITTCECDPNDPENPPPYRIKMKNVVIKDGQFVKATKARLQLGKANTPLFLPMVRPDENAPWTIDFDTGSRAELGSFLNVGQRFRINDDLQLGPRLYITQDEGVGFGGDAFYDYTETPSSRLFLTKGEVHTLYTTEERGYFHWYHRYRHSDNLQVKMQVEHWSDSDFYSDFYYQQYKNRTTPRTFANVTYRQEDYIATATAKPNTHGWVSETERLPEASFHVPERSIADRLYLSFDTVAGYNNREPADIHGGRSISVARLTYDLDPFAGLSLTPFTEFSGAFYTDSADNGGTEDWASALVGVTAQTRLQRTYGGVLGFSGFKHIVVPSITLSHRPEVGEDENEIAYYDSWDNVSGRTRIESKLDNIILGKAADTGEVWQVGRLTLYQGNDFWNENHQSDHYEMELDVRPRAWWGMQLVGERHITENDLSLDDPGALETFLVERIEDITGRPIDAFQALNFNTQFGDYDRVLAQVYYDDIQNGGKFNGRLGFSYTETRDIIFNREVLYGLGYRIGDEWSVAFEHRYDFEDGDLRTQSYEIRRIWDCWETAIRFQDRERGFDVNFEIALTALPGTKLKL